MKNKTIVFTFIASSFTLASIFFSVIIIYDPLKLFHKPWVYKEYLQTNIRQQAAGILRNWSYDSIILGTSMLECTSAKEASEELGGEFINISLSGSSFYERSIVLDYALRHKNLKKVIFSLDSGGGLVTSSYTNPIYKMTDWNYLYDENIFNDFNVYINKVYLKCMFSFSSNKECMGEKVDFNRPNTWHNIPSQAQRFGGLDKWFKETNPQIEKEYKKYLKKLNNIKEGNINTDKLKHDTELSMQEYINSTLVKFIIKYPNTEFNLIVPPYSRIHYAMMAQGEIAQFEQYKSNIRYLVKESKKLNNLKIYGWGNSEFLDDVKRYKDLDHYDYKINSWMLNAMKENNGLLNSSNIDNYLDAFSTKALNYDLSTFRDKLQNHLSRK